MYIYIHVNLYTAVWLVDRKMPHADVTWKPNIR